MKKNIQPTIIILLFIVVAYLLKSFFAKGMFFALDASFPEKFSFSSSFASMSLWGNFCYFLNQFFSVETIQKLIYGGLFIFLLIGSYSNAPFTKQPAKLFFALALTFNPFVYSRFLAGQYAVIIGYTLFVQLVLTAFENESARKYSWLAGWLILLHICSVHFMFLSVLFLGIYFIVHIFVLKDLSIKHIGPLFIFIIVFISTSLPVLLQPKNIQTFTAFNIQDLNIFYTLSDASFGLLGNVFSLFGFWFEGEEGISLKSHAPLWPITAVVYIVLGIVGTYYFLKKEEKNIGVIGRGFLIFLGFCLFLVIAPSVSLLKPIVVFLYEKIGILYILREPHKAMGVLAFFYAYFGAYAIQQKKIQTLPGILISLLLVFTLFGFMQGFSSEIKMSAYPESWNEARVFLNKQKEVEKTLIFPWHSYMPMKFSYDKKIYNVAGVYFGNNTIIADNYEVAGLYTHNIGVQQRHIDGLLKMEWENKNLLEENVEITPQWGKDLQPLGISTIILLKEYDWKQYAFLDKQKDIKVLFENSDIKIYKTLP